MDLLILKKMICLFQELIAMINSKALNGLFKPHKVVKADLTAYIIEHVGLRKFWKMQFEQECSKATDESCINNECRYNFLKVHKDELYIDLMQEIQAERKEIEDRNKRAMEKYYGE